MASSSPSAALLLLCAFSLFVTGAVGRPCKTFLISYTVSSASALEISAAGGQVPPHFFAFYRVIPVRYDPDLPYSAASAAATEPLATALRLHAGIQRPAEPALAVSSVRERARDILVVVAGLLFGVGCGALTSATMYLAWYLFSHRDEVCGARGYGYLDDVDDVESPKKRGYTDIPAAPATPVSPLKEGHEGN